MNKRKKLCKRAVSYLLSMALILSGFMLPTEWVRAEESEAITYTAIEASNGEPCDTLFDGKYTAAESDARWFAWMNSDESVWVMFKASEPVKVNGYSLVTGDLSAVMLRNPKSWILYGCNSQVAADSEEWEIIDSIEDEMIEETSYFKTDFPVSNQTKCYQYFKLKVTKNGGGSTLELSEIIIDGTPCEHSPADAGVVTAATCTEQGYITHTCSMCGRIYNTVTEPFCHVMADGKCSRCNKDLEAYIDYVWNEEDNVLEQTRGYFAVDAGHKVSTGGTTWKNGWYFAEESCMLDERVYVYGTVHLVLADDAVLQIRKGISVDAGSSLYIHAQSTDHMGELSITPPKLRMTSNQGFAGIGGDKDHSCGDVIINGGIINVTGDSGGAGIGGGNGRNDGGHGGTVTINGGIVNASGGQDAAGIGGGENGNGGTVIINGGTVSATGNSGGAGIGGGYQGNGADVTITGGNVKASGRTTPIGKGAYASSDGTLKDGAGREVSLKTISLCGMTTETALTSLTDSLDYGIQDIATLDTNKLYFYLPENADIEAITAGTKTYRGKDSERTESSCTYHCCNTYTQEENSTDSITGTCSTATCDESNTITIAESDAEYTGKPIKAEVTESNAGLLSYECTYEALGENTLNENGLPVNPGEYRAGITIGEINAYKDFEITKANLSVTKATATGRIYEAGNTSVAVTDVALSGVAEGETVSVNMSNLMGILSAADAGTYTELTLPNLTLTGEDMGNYTLIQPSEAVPTDVTITPKDSHPMTGVSKQYVYAKENTDTISLAAFLPEDCGTVIGYAEPEVDGDITYTTAPSVSKEGELTYTIAQGTEESIGKQAEITVKVQTQNYSEVPVSITIEITGRIAVSPQTEIQLKDESKELVYGQKLSELELAETEFKGEDGKTVDGAFRWKNADSVPTVNTTEAEWEFIPSANYMGEYKSLEGKIAIHVTPAVPYILTAPNADTITYGEALKDSVLSGGEVHNVAMNTVVPGTWSWKEADVVPAVVDNKDYVAVFTPTDADNYNTVETKLTVIVNQAPEAPNKPSAVMTVKTETVGAVELPQGWEWQEADRMTSLEAGKQVKATAVYIGADKGNYVVESIEIAITREAASDKETEEDKDQSSNPTEEDKNQSSNPTEEDKDQSSNPTEEDKDQSSESTEGDTSASTLPAVGEKRMSEDKKATYQITQSAKTKKTVTYVKTEDKKAKTVSIPDSVTIAGVTYQVTAIAKNAYKNNKYLTKVIIGKNITSIGDNAFYGCKNLKSVTIGKNTKKIGKKAFYGCRKLRTLTVKSTKLTTKKIGSKAFAKTYKKMNVKVPKKKLKAYKSMLKKRGVDKKAKFKKN